MGACCSDGIPKGTSSDRSKNAAIARRMKQELANEPYTHRIILLGPGDAGKTTLLKQMRKIYGGPDANEDEVVDNGYTNVIKERIMHYMRILCEQSIKFEIELEEKNIDSRNFFVSKLTAPFVNYFNDETVSKMKNLWKDEGIQETLKRRNEYQIPDNIEYFLGERLDVIASKDYKVSFQDFLRIRVRTTGFINEKFTKKVGDKKHEFFFTDVGGQRSERNKWINMMTDDIDAVLYIVAVSEYDVNCFEDSKTNRLDEALNLFQEVIEKGFCNGKTITIFFNKFDLLEAKLADPNSKTIADIFPNEFPKNKDPRNIDHVVQFIYDKFLKVYKQKLRESDQATTTPHHHLTTALDTHQIELLMHDIENDLIKSRLLTVDF